MSSSNRKKNLSTGESVPLLQTQPQPSPTFGSPQPTYNASATGPPQQQYGAAVGYPGYVNPEMQIPTQQNASNTKVASSSYFVSPPGQYPMPSPNQQSPMIIYSPNQQHQQMPAGGEDGGGTMAPPPYFYPFPPPQGGTLPPQYQYPIYPIQQQRQPPPPMGPNSGIQPVNTISHSPKTSGNLPPLNDIFNASGGKDSQGSGYGSMSTSPKIYNAPIHRLPPSGRTPQQLGQQPIKRTNSSNEMKPKRDRDHRRVNSDSPLRVNRMHRRANTDEALPRRYGSGHNRSRTLSSGNFPKPRHHRRVDSSNSYHSMGGGSYTGRSVDSSQISLRSNIAKSTLFAGVDKEGRPLLYYPYEAIRLVMIPDPETRESTGGRRYSDQSDDDTAEQEDHLPLEIGHLYSDEPVDIDDYYEAYHRISDELEQGLAPQWESLDAHPLSKLRRSGSDGQLTQDDKQGLLPPTNYVVAVSDDIYRRIFSEVSDAQTLPCGLFFCGHHEDVDTPSALIPTALVIILFGTLFYLAYLTEF